MPGLRSEKKVSSEMIRSAMFRKPYTLDSALRPEPIITCFRCCEVKKTFIFNQKIRRQIIRLKNVSEKIRRLQKIVFL